MFVHFPLAAALVRFFERTVESQCIQKLEIVGHVTTKNSEFKENTPLIFHLIFLVTQRNF